jgi:hypothetical protein
MMRASLSFRIDVIKDRSLIFTTAKTARFKKTQLTFEFINDVV